MSSYTCISADSHVVEPGDLWVERIDPAYRDRAPRAVKEDGNDVFKGEGVDYLGVSGVSAAGKQAGQIRPQGTYAEDVYPGAYDPDERLKDQDKDGVQAEVVYPSVAMRMYAIADAGFQAACFRAYNDWMSDFCGAHPDRLKGLALSSVEDVEGAVAELHRSKKIGLSGVVVGLYPDDDSMQYDNPTLDPFWSTASDSEMPVSIHILTNKAKLSARTPVMRSTEVVWAQKTLAAMIFGGVFQRFPQLRVVSAENDAGWAPYLMERMDYVFSRGLPASPFSISGGTETPSDFFRRNVYATFMRDRSGVLAREQIGVERLMWASDFPHFDSTWPHSQEMIDNYLFKDVPEADKRRILADNAVELYGFK